MTELWTTATMVAARLCPMRKAADPVPPKHCWWCGEPVPKRRQRWCGDGCLAEYASNHEWSSSRAATLKRDDYRCVKCGDDAGTRRPAHGSASRADDACGSRRADAAGTAG